MNKDLFLKSLGELKDLYNKLEESYSKLQIKLEAARSKNPDDYLIVEDREMPTKWHLQVKVNGKPDHRLMGAAWAALTVGYRGNKYEGPRKQEAMRKLKALYKKEGLKTPDEK